MDKLISSCVAFLALIITLDNLLLHVRAAPPMELSITDLTRNPAVSLQLNLDADIDSLSLDDAEDDEDSYESEESGQSDSTIGINNGCPNGFIRHRRSCYHVVESSGAMTWEIANTYCQFHNSHLVDIQSESEQIFIENLISTKQERSAFWIGGTNRKGKGAWEWSSGEGMSYTLWVSHWSSLAYEIDPGSCALIDSAESNQWMFWPCNNNFYMTGKQHDTQSGIGFICEIESTKGSHKVRHRKHRRRRRRRRKGRRRRNHFQRLIGQNLLNAL